MYHFLYMTSFLVSSIEFFPRSSTLVREEARKRLGGWCRYRWRRIPRTIFSYFMIAADSGLLFFLFSKRQNEEFTRYPQSDRVIILFSLSKRHFWDKERIQLVLNHNTKLPLHLPNTKDSDHQNFITQIYTQHPLQSFTLHPPNCCRGPYL